MDSQIFDLPSRSEAEEEHAHTATLDHEDGRPSDGVGIIDLPSRSEAGHENTHDATLDHEDGSHSGSHVAGQPAPPQPLRTSDAERPTPLTRAPVSRTTYLASSAVVLVAVAGMGWMLTHGHHHQATGLAVSEVGSTRADAGPVRQTQPSRQVAPQSQDLNELVGMRSPPRMNAAVPVHLIETKATPDRPASAATSAAASPAVVPQTAPLPTALAAPEDAADKLARLQAAPMSPAQQVQVLDLVSEAAALIQKQRSELANLRHDQEQLHAKVEGALEDFSRRLSLREASAGLAAAEGNAAPVGSTAPMQAALVRVRAALASAATTAPPARLPTSPAIVTVHVALPPHHYRVQAASPRLAMLADDNPVAGQSGQIAVAVGDVLAGWGRVTSISQRNTEWIVKTDHGIIE